MSYAMINGERRDVELSNEKFAKSQKVKAIGSIYGNATVVMCPKKKIFGVVNNEFSGIKEIEIEKIQGDKAIFLNVAKKKKQINNNDLFAL